MPEGPEIRLAADRVAAVLVDKTVEKVTFGLPRLRAFDAWAYDRNIRLHFIQPGKPMQNAFVETFNGSFRDGFLNEALFSSPAKVR